MTTPSDHTKLIDLLDKAEKLAREFQGGYSGQFLSAKEFHQALFDSINKFKQGDNTQLDKLHIWCTYRHVDPPKIDSLFRDVDPPLMKRYFRR